MSNPDSSVARSVRPPRLVTRGRPEGAAATVRSCAKKKKGPPSIRLPSGKKKRAHCNFPIFFLSRPVYFCFVSFPGNRTHRRDALARATAGATAAAFIVRAAIVMFFERDRKGCAEEVTRVFSGRETQETRAQLFPDALATSFLVIRFRRSSANRNTRWVWRNAEHTWHPTDQIW